MENDNEECEGSREWTLDSHWIACNGVDEETYYQNVANDRSLNRTARAEELLLNCASVGPLPYAVDSLSNRTRNHSLPQGNTLMNRANDPYYNSALDSYRNCSGSASNPGFLNRANNHSLPRAATSLSNDVLLTRAENLLLNPVDDPPLDCAVDSYRIANGTHTNGGNYYACSSVDESRWNTPVSENEISILEDVFRAAKGYTEEYKGLLSSVKNTNDDYAANLRNSMILSKISEERIGNVNGFTSLDSTVYGASLLDAIPTDFNEENDLSPVSDDLLSQSHDVHCRCKLCYINKPSEFDSINDAQLPKCAKLGISHPSITPLIRSQATVSNSEPNLTPEPDSEVDAVSQQATESAAGIEYATTNCVVLLHAVDSVTTSTDSSRVDALKRGSCQTTNEGSILGRRKMDGINTFASGGAKTVAKPSNAELSRVEVQLRENIRDETACSVTYECTNTEKCNLSFPSETDRLKHEWGCFRKFIRVRHNNSCVRCGKIFSTVKFLRIHQGGDGKLNESGVNSYVDATDFPKSNDLTSSPNATEIINETKTSDASKVTELTPSTEVMDSFSITKTADLSKVTELTQSTEVMDSNLKSEDVIRSMGKRKLADKSSELGIDSKSGLVKTTSDIDINSNVACQNTNDSFEPNTKLQKTTFVSEPKCAKTNECVHCNLCFPARIHFSHEMRCVKKNLRKDYFRCELCDKKFPNRKYLQDHKAETFPISPALPDSNKRLPNRSDISGSSDTRIKPTITLQKYTGMTSQSYLSANNPVKKSSHADSIADNIATSHMRNPENLPYPPLQMTSRRFIKTTFEISDPANSSDDRSHQKSSHATSRDVMKPPTKVSQLKDSLADHSQQTSSQKTLLDQIVATTETSDLPNLSADHSQQTSSQKTLLDQIVATTETSDLPNLSADQSRQKCSQKPSLDQIVATSRIRDQTTPSKKYVCSKTYECAAAACGLSFVSMNLKTEHEIRCKGKLPRQYYQCHYCDKKFLHRNYLKDHKVECDEKEEVAGNSELAGNSEVAGNGELAGNSEVASHGNSINVASQPDKGLTSPRSICTKLQEYVTNRASQCDIDAGTKINVEKSIPRLPKSGDSSINGIVLPVPCKNVPATCDANDALSHHNESLPRKSICFGTFECAQCDLSFATEKDRYVHGLSCAGTSDGGYPCEICGKRFSLSSHLQQHVLVLNELSSIIETSQMDGNLLEVMETSQNSPRETSQIGVEPLPKTSQREASFSSQSSQCNENSISKIMEIDENSPRETSRLVARSLREMSHTGLSLLRRELLRNTLQTDATSLNQITQIDENSSCKVSEVDHNTRFTSKTDNSTHSIDTEPTQIVSANYERYQEDHIVESSVAQLSQTKAQHSQTKAQHSQTNAQHSSKKEKYKCMYCQKQFSSMSSGFAHEAYLCPKIGKLMKVKTGCQENLGKSNSKSRGKMRVKSIAPKESKNHECSRRGMRYRVKGELIKHNPETCGKVFQCAVCNKSFKMKSKLKNHIIRSHALPNHKSNQNPQSSSNTKVFKETSIMQSPSIFESKVNIVEQPSENSVVAQDSSICDGNIVIDKNFENIVNHFPNNVVENNCENSPTTAQHSNVEEGIVEYNQEVKYKEENVSTVSAGSNVLHLEEYSFENVVENNCENSPTTAQHSNVEEGIVEHNQDVEYKEENVSTVSAGSNVLHLEEYSFENVVENNCKNSPTTAQHSNVEVGIVEHNQEVKYKEENVSTVSAGSNVLHLEEYSFENDVENSPNNVDKFENSLQHNSLIAQHSTADECVKNIVGRGENSAEHKDGRLSIAEPGNTEHRNVDNIENVVEHFSSNNDEIENSHAKKCHVAQHPIVDEGDEYFSSKVGGIENSYAENCAVAQHFIVEEVVENITHHGENNEDEQLSRILDSIEEFIPYSEEVDEQSNIGDSVGIFFDSELPIAQQSSIVDGIENIRNRAVAPYFCVTEDITAHYRKNNTHGLSVVDSIIRVASDEKSVRAMENHENETVSSSIFESSGENSDLKNVASCRKVDGYVARNNSIVEDTKNQCSEPEPDMDDFKISSAQNSKESPDYAENDFSSARNILESRLHVNISAQIRIEKPHDVERDSGSLQNDVELQNSVKINDVERDSGSLQNEVELQNSVKINDVERDSGSLRNDVELQNSVKINDVERDSGSLQNDVEYQNSVKINDVERDSGSLQNDVELQNSVKRNDTTTRNSDESPNRTEKVDASIFAKINNYSAENDFKSSKDAEREYSSAQNIVEPSEDIDLLENSFAQNCVESTNHGERDNYLLRNDIDSSQNHEEGNVSIVQYGVEIHMRDVKDTNSSSESSEKLPIYTEIDTPQDDIEAENSVELLIQRKKDALQNDIEAGNCIEIPNYTKRDTLQTDIAAENSVELPDRTERDTIQIDIDVGNSKLPIHTERMRRFNAIESQKENNDRVEKNTSSVHNSVELPDRTERDTIQIDIDIGNGESSIHTERIRGFNSIEWQKENNDRIEKNASSVRNSVELPKGVKNINNSAKNRFKLANLPVLFNQTVIPGSQASKITNGVVGGKNFDINSLAASKSANKKQSVTQSEVTGDKKNKKESTAPISRQLRHTRQNFPREIITSDAKEANDNKFDTSTTKKLRITLQNINANKGNETREINLGSPTLERLRLTRGDYYNKKDADFATDPVPDSAFNLPTLPSKKLHPTRQNVSRNNNLIATNQSTSSASPSKKLHPTRQNASETNQSTSSTSPSKKRHQTRQNVSRNNNLFATNQSTSSASPSKNLHPTRQNASENNNLVATNQSTSSASPSKKLHPTRQNASENNNSNATNQSTSSTSSSKNLRQTRLNVSRNNNLIATNQSTSSASPSEKLHPTRQNASENNNSNATNQSTSSTSPLKKLRQTRLNVSRNNNLIAKNQSTSSASPSKKLHPTLQNASENNNSNATNQSTSSNSPSKKHHQMRQNVSENNNLIATNQSTSSTSPLKKLHSTRQNISENNNSNATNQGTSLTSPSKKLHQTRQNISEKNNSNATNQSALSTSPLKKLRHTLLDFPKNSYSLEKPMKHVAKNRSELCKKGFDASLKKGVNFLIGKTERYKCPHCCNTYSRNDSVPRHILTTHLRCQSCHKCFLRECELNKHRCARKDFATKLLPKSGKRTTEIRNQSPNPLSKNEHRGTRRISVPNLPPKSGKRKTEIKNLSSNLLPKKELRTRPRNNHRRNVTLKKKISTSTNSLLGSEKMVPRAKTLLANDDPQKEIKQLWSLVLTPKIL